MTTKRVFKGQVMGWNGGKSCWSNTRAPHVSNSKAMHVHLTCQTTIHFNSYQSISLGLMLVLKHLTETEEIFSTNLKDSTELHAQTDLQLQALAVIHLRL